MLLDIGLFGGITAIVTNTLVASADDATSGGAVSDLERLAALHASEAITT